MGDRGENIGALVWVSYESMGVGGDMVTETENSERNSSR